MICVKELVKNFDDVCAVNNITLNIPEGEMLGLLGTNGAGKTTLLRMIAGVLEADGGSIVVDGANITSGDVSEEIFYLPDDPYFFPNASMEEMILFYKKYYPRMDAEAAAYMAGKLIWKRAPTSYIFKRYETSGISYPCPLCRNKIPSL